MSARELAPELQAILRAQEMRGERIVNNIRFWFYLASALMVFSVLHINTVAANVGFIVQAVIGVGYSAGLHLYFRRAGGRYVPWLKYVSITVDICLLEFAAVPMSMNHYGIIEFFHSFVPLLLVLWNLLSALRYSVPACLYSGFLSLGLSALVLISTVTGDLVAISAISVWGEQAINIADESVRVIFIATPGFVAAVIASISRGLILRAEEESLSRIHAEQQKAQLARYVSSDIADYVLQDPQRMGLGGIRREATVFFSDVRNFTPLTEDNEPEAVVALLNDYFTEMAAIVFKYGGTLDKYLGDGLMALFGVPFPLHDAELRATLCGLEMLARVEAMNAELGLVERGLPPLNIGVGIATGTVIAGNIGSEERMEYTVIGDTVNFAARLESMNRALGTHIIVSESTREALGDRLPLRPLPPLKVKGKKGTPKLFAVQASKLGPERLAELRAGLLDAPAAPQGAEAG